MSPAATAETTKTIDAPTLKALLEDNPNLTVIDVRNPAEFESAHLPGSHNIPLPLLSAHTVELSARLGSDVVILCQSGVRAKQAHERLAAAGLEGGQVLTGSVDDVEKAGGSVVRGKQVWDMERQVRFAAGSLVGLGLLAGRVASPKFRMLAGGISGGLVFSALSNTCAMGKALAYLPWNQGASEPSWEEIQADLDR
ncbi:rhodanese-like domain-containing protein [Arthrobacter caoxuetaonis]|uniref:Rhodanese-like domain-containing protein n=1 Tax=Arthrobacter caoxuetaonis TaxID=2886935 RepID=A0A9X1MCQ3_9MICC|nr:rhodanese-like domain-containing protein [Arthrobacter caoxuetaonis]MCC3297563.1 rhodanese-like domain-containing protein [Arthrobacter caoxuetaonis]USQ57909.1 rhodanese-like domain-containing protein [Arthrobacter caoxuetaonis]